MFNKGQELLAINQITKKVTRLLHTKHEDYNKDILEVNNDFYKSEIQIYNDLQDVCKSYAKVIAFTKRLDTHHIENQEKLKNKILYLNSEIDKVTKEKLELEEHIKQVEQHYINYIKDLEDKLSKFSRNKTVSEEQQKKIKEMINNGIPFREISKQEGVSICIISKIKNNKY